MAAPRPAGRAACTCRGALVLLLLAVGGCAPRAAAPPDRAWAERLPTADSLQVTSLRPGVRHIHAWLAEGPWSIHVVEIDEARCRPLVAAVKAGPPLRERATTSTLGGDGLAAINADFFMLPEGTPVGPHVRAGRVLAGPGSRPAYGMDATGRHWAGGVLLAGWVAARADTAALEQVNRPQDSGRHHPSRPGLALFDAWYGREAPVGEGRTLRVRRLAGGAAEGPRPGQAAEGRGVVVASHEAGTRVPLDDRHVAVQARGDEAAAWLQRRAPGDTVFWTAAVLPASGPGGAAAEAVGGFPLLLHDGRGVYAEQTGVVASFGEARHPRTAVGWDTAGARVLWVVVDGRQPGYSEGMTLPELETLLLDLGATHALNLDGGGSTTLVIRGDVANRPSDPEGERPVSNALVVQGCGPG